MKKTFGSAALFIALVAAPDAIAQRLTAQPVLETAPAVGPSILLTSRPSPIRETLFQQGSNSGQTSGVGISTRTYAEQDGSTAIQRGLIGNWPLVGRLEAGVGLFSVVGDGRKHNEFKRSWSVKEVTPKTENIAAVGMRFHF